MRKDRKCLRPRYVPADHIKLKDVNKQDEKRVPAQGRKYLGKPLQVRLNEATSPHNASTTRIGTNHIPDQCEERRPLYAVRHSIVAVDANRDNPRGYRHNPERTGTPQSRFAPRRRVQVPQA